MADTASIIAAVGGAVATVLTAWSAYRSARVDDRLKSLEADHARAAKDTGQRLYGLIDTVNTLDDRTRTMQRKVERIPTESQWNFRLGQTPPGGNVTTVQQTQPLRGPAPPTIPPVNQEDEDK